ncbi:MAG: hypothetical protein RLZZ86_2288, partial [Cyanobacteriota bacterium]
MIKTSLKRGLMAMVAMTVPIVGSSVKANAQAVGVVPNATITPITAQVPQPKPTPPSGTKSNQQNQNLPTTPPTSSPNPETTEARVLVSEVVVKTETGKITPELEAEIYKVIRTQAGQTTTRSQLQEDINAIVRIGLFSNVQALPEDTPVGVRVSFIVTPNPILTKVELEANPGTGVASVLPAETAQEIFSSQ